LDFLASGKLPAVLWVFSVASQMKELINELTRRYDFVSSISTDMGSQRRLDSRQRVDMTLQVIQYRASAANDIRAKH